MDDDYTTLLGTKESGFFDLAIQAETESGQRAWLPLGVTVNPPARDIRPLINRKPFFESLPLSDVAAFDFSSESSGNYEY